MRVLRPHPDLDLRVWFGLLAAPAAWGSMHVFGIGLTQAACYEAGTRWDVPVDLWTAIATSLAALLALAGLLTSIRVARTTTDAPPPEGRRHFLAIVGVTISPLFLFMILMGGIGAIVLQNCHQA